MRLLQTERFVQRSLRWEYGDSGIFDNLQLPIESSCTDAPRILGVPCQLVPDEDHPAICSLGLIEHRLELSITRRIQDDETLEIIAIKRSFHIYIWLTVSQALIVVLGDRHNCSLRLTVLSHKELGWFTKNTIEIALTRTQLSRDLCARQAWQTWVRNRVRTNIPAAVPILDLGDGDVVTPARSLGNDVLS